MAELQKLSRNEIDRRLKGNPYAGEILQVFENAYQDGKPVDYDGLDDQLCRISKKLSDNKARITAMQTVKDGDTHFTYRFNPHAAGADKDILAIHNIEVARKLLDCLHCSTDTFYERMNFAVQGQMAYGMGPTFATSLMRMRERGLEEMKLKERCTVTAQF